MADDTIRCLCAKCRAFTEHTIPGGKCTVCSADLPTREDIAGMSSKDLPPGEILHIPPPLSPKMQGQPDPDETHLLLAAREARGALRKCQHQIRGHGSVSSTLARITKALDLLDDALDATKPPKA